jgi:hypothetical protein
MTLQHSRSNNELKGRFGVAFAEFPPKTGDPASIRTLQQYYGTGTSLDIAPTKELNFSTTGGTTTCREPMLGPALTRRTP